jgi:hypothetical protein
MKWRAASEQVARHVFFKVTKSSIWSSLLLDVIPVNPTILLRAILSFEKDVAIVFAGYHLHAPRYILR